MKEEIVGIEENEYGNYECICPKCGHIIIIHKDIESEKFDALSSNETVDIYCDNCDNKFMGELV